MIKRNFSLARTETRTPDQELEFITVADTCVLVYVDRDDQVLLVRQFRAIFGVETLELPGGSREANESEEECAIREFREEAGIEVSAASSLGKAALSVGTSDEIVSIFLARESVQVAFAVPQLQCLRVPIDECLTLLSSQRVPDAKSMLGIALALRQL